MKKLTMLFAVMMFVVVGSFSSALAEESVPYANAPAYVPGQTYTTPYQQPYAAYGSSAQSCPQNGDTKRLKRIEKILKGDKKNLGIIRQLNDISSENKAFAENSKLFAENSKAYVEVGKSQIEATKALDGTFKKFASDARKLLRDQTYSLGIQAKNNAWFQGILIIVMGLLIIGAVIGAFWYRTRCSNKNIGFIKTDVAVMLPLVQEMAENIKNIEAAQHADRTDDVLKAIVNVAADNRDCFKKAIADVPKKTVEEMNKLTPEPFEIDIAGKHVTYVSPAEGIAEGYYMTLKIEDTHGSTNPANFDRQTWRHRGQTKNYLTGTMKKFLEGKLTGTPEELLIRYLISTKEIVIS